MTIIIGFVSIIWIFLCVSGKKEPTIFDDVIKTLDISQEEYQARSPIMHHMYRKPGRSSRIIGGGTTNPHQYPYQVFLKIRQNRDSFVCGGTLLSTEWILTASHCVYGSNRIRVYMGAHNLHEANRNYMDSKYYITHEKYQDKDTSKDDIGLVKLPQKAKLNEFVQIVDLMIERKPFAGHTARCLGWGFTLLGSTSNVLRYVDVEIMTNQACQRKFLRRAVIFRTEVCTSGAGIVGSCSGDSGGPLILNNKQVGIVAWGPACDEGSPSVYTRVPDYIEWISEKTGIDFGRKNRSYSCKAGYMKAFIAITLTVIALF